MAITKVVLSVTVPGSQMIDREEARKTPKESTDHQALWIQSEKYSKENKRKETVNECLHIFTRKSIPAKQSLNISMEAYNYMISEDSCPYHKHKKDWKKMSATQRLECHLRDIMETLGGSKFVYEVLPD